MYVYSEAVIWGVKHILLPLGPLPWVYLVPGRWETRSRWDPTGAGINAFIERRPSFCIFIWWWMLLFLWTVSHWVMQVLVNTSFSPTQDSEPWNTPRSAAHRLWLTGSLLTGQRKHEWLWLSLLVKATGRTPWLEPLFPRCCGSRAELLQAIYTAAGILCSQHYQGLYKWSLGKIDGVHSVLISVLNIFQEGWEEGGGKGVRFSHFCKVSHP